MLQVVIARFAQDRALGGQLELAQAQLSDRKVVERAKDILMTELGLSEDQAFGHLRKLAMASACAWTCRGRAAGSIWSKTGPTVMRERLTSPAIVVVGDVVRAAPLWSQAETEAGANENRISKLAFIRSPA